MENHDLPAESFTELKSFIDQQDDREASLIPVLYEAQHLFGYLPREVLFFVSEQLHIPVSKIYGVVSFYSFFTTKPKGRNQVRICRGTACFVSGCERIAQRLEYTLDLKIGETSADREFSLEEVRCVGACSLAPALLINDDVHAKVRPEDVDSIIKRHRR